MLVPNRGEIAVRIIRACADEMIESVAALSEPDMNSLPALLADRAVCLGPADASQSYLDVGRVVTAALGTGCDAIHPGYGFLSERPELADACAEHEIAFVGPPATAIREGGDKLAARRVAEDAGIPVGAGSQTAANLDDALKSAESVGYPVLLKAAAGGGGKGMVHVEAPQVMRQRFSAAQHEAQQAFGDGRLYVEHYVTNARHVEVQVMADRYGDVVHLGARDCSSQRRYQKLVEEAPATLTPPRLRDDMCAAAVTLAETLDYVGAGTVEFIVDVDAATFGFLEVNTRVQVEHPVTEMVTGIDIVREQLRVAGGARLSFEQDEVTFDGHAIECRINAEDARAGFVPTPGTITEWVEPVSTEIRVDTHCRIGAVVPPYYDSLLAKAIAHGKDRDEAIERLRRALGRFRIEGVSSTVPFHLELLSHPDFRSGATNTRWVEETFVPAWAVAKEDPDGA